VTPIPSAVSVERWSDHTEQPSAKQSSVTSHIQMSLLRDSAEIRSPPVDLSSMHSVVAANSFCPWNVYCHSKRLHIVRKPKIKPTIHRIWQRLNLSHINVGKICQCLWIDVMEACMLEWLLFYYYLFLLFC